MPKRYLFYFFIFAIISLFDFFTHMVSWTIEITTGLINEGGGFPDDYVGTMIFLTLFVFAGYSLMKLKRGETSKTREIILAITGVIAVIFSLIVFVSIASMIGWTN
jgi:hypothetical protein